ncbi:MAG: DUF3866 family protein [Actinomycetota bacterium]
MPKFATGVVSAVLAERDGLQRLMVRVGDQDRPATAFTGASGPIAEGDRVVVNTTAVDLGLGSGGEDFVVWNLERAEAGALGGGHILKLRYTPWQVDTLAVEAPESPHHAALAETADLGGMPVVACGVHSQVPAAVAVLKRERPDLRVAYLMTDGAALPLAYSDSVARLKELGLIDTTLTCGHAFGGDLECVNLFSGLVAARHAAEADVAVVAMGPGIVGTETLLGHTGMEQGQILDAAVALGGVPIAALRISFADPRERHQRVSHHTISALRYAATQRCILAVPDLPYDQLAAVLDQLDKEGLLRIHEHRVVESEALEALEAFGLAPESMGRSVGQDPAYHLAAGAAGMVAAHCVASPVWKR